jgi:hypothetical protein
MTTTLEGGCLCGAVRFRLDEAPQSSSICHCRSCRRASAAPSVAWVSVARERFVLLAGSPKAYASSPGVTRTFCERCGSPITYANDDSAETLDVTTVSLDEPERFPPTREIWLEDKLAWQPTDAHLGHFARWSQEGAPS